MPPSLKDFNRPTYLDDEPTISQEDGIRYLHFGTEWIQGAMRTARPSELVLAYTQQMMAWLLFTQPTKRDLIGVLGLGAGSLTRYCLKHTLSTVDTVEWNPAVVAVCRSFFRLPTSKRSRIQQCDAGDWVEDPSHQAQYSALMVDLYDADAQGPVRDSLAFYEGCYRVLADEGVVTINLFGEHHSFEPNLERIREAFKGRMLMLPEIDAGNRVVLGIKGPLLETSVQAFLDRADQVESRYGLPARRWARALLSQGPFSRDFP